MCVLTFTSMSELLLHFRSPQHGQSVLDLSPEPPVEEVKTPEVKGPVEGEGAGAGVEKKADEGGEVGISTTTIGVVEEESEDERSDDDSEEDSDDDSDDDDDSDGGSSE
jgi:hypothetical protein